MVAQQDAARRLWPWLQALTQERDGASVVECVALTLHDGSRPEVFKAELANEALPIWRIRAMQGHGAELAERRGLLLGTRDGRAILTTSLTPAAGGELDGAPIMAVSRTERPLSDLSELIARAVRRRLDEPQ